LLLYGVLVIFLRDRLPIVSADSMLRMLACMCGLAETIPTSIHTALQVRGSGLCGWAAIACRSRGWAHPPPPKKTKPRQKPPTPSKVLGVKEWRWLERHLCNNEACPGYVWPPQHPSEWQAEDTCPECQVGQRFKTVVRGGRRQLEPCAWFISFDTKVRRADLAVRGINPTTHS
jgi:hypothetical protein